LPPEAADRLGGVGSASRASDLPIVAIAKDSPLTDLFVVLAPNANESGETPPPPPPPLGEIPRIKW